MPKRASAPRSASAGSLSRSARAPVFLSAGFRRRVPGPVPSGPRSPRAAETRWLPLFWFALRTARTARERNARQHSAWHQVARRHTNAREPQPARSPQPPGLRRRVWAARPRRRRRHCSDHDPAPHHAAHHDSTTGHAHLRDALPRTASRRPPQAQQARAAAPRRGAAGYREGARKGREVEITSGPRRGVAKAPSGAEGHGTTKEED